MKILNFDEVQAVSGGNFLVATLICSFFASIPPVFISREKTIIAGAAFGSIITTFEGFMIGQGFLGTLCTASLGGIAGALGGGGIAYIGYEIGSQIDWDA